MSSPTPRLSVVIPAYNEAHRIEPTLAEVMAYCRSVDYPTEVLVVDDGSSDGTAAVVERAAPEVRVVRHEPNRGKGYSVREGIRESRGEYVLFMDADNSTPIREVEKLWPKFEAGADAVIGSRALPESVIRRHQSFLRETAGKCFNVLVRLLLSTPFRDTQCGFKAFRRESVLPVLGLLRIDRFGFDPELLHVLQKQGNRIVDVPIEWTNEPQTRLNVMRDSLGMFGELVKIRWWDLRGCYRRKKQQD